MLANAFDDPVMDAQSVFRTVMNAMARPGVVQPLVPIVSAPAPLSAGAGCVALTLLDYETPVWLDPHLSASSEAAAWLRFHTGAPITNDPGQAVFALIADLARAPDLSLFATGSSDYPDRSTTVILQVEELRGGDSFVLEGPGIKEQQTFSARPLPFEFDAQLRSNRQMFPRGVDVLLVAEREVVGIPRSAIVTKIMKD